MHAVTEVRPIVGAQPRTKGETYEGLAFTFCKAATIILLTQKFAPDRRILEHRCASLNVHDRLSFARTLRGCSSCT